MVNIGRIEPHKENLRPAIDGRHLEILSMALNEERNTRESRTGGPSLASPELDDIDPLAAIANQVTIYLSSPPSKANTLELLALLSSAVEKFSSWDMYKNDLRFVRLCLNYGALSEEPQEMFDYMESNKIGGTCALFYESYANFLEGTQRVSSARKKIEEGLQYGAQPTTSLRIFLADLNRRHPVRSTTKMLKDTNGTTERKLQGGNNVLTMGRLQIYTGGNEASSDEEGDASAVAPTKHDTTQPRKLPRVSIDRKENLIPAEPLVDSGRDIPQGIAATAPPQHLQVFRDNESTATFEILEAVRTERPRTIVMELLESRKMKPRRPFDPIPRRLRIITDETELGTNLIGTHEQEFAPMLYEHHSSATELIAKQFMSAEAGDAEQTEVLSKP